MSDAFHEHFARTDEGLTLYVRDYAPKGEPRGVPVVCLHGLTRNSRDFENLAPFVAATGRRVIVPDMRGRGRSDRDPDPSRYRVEIYAADVVRILDHVGIPSAVFVGTSMGGLITMALAALVPDRIAAAVLNDIGPIIDPAGIARIMGYVGRGGPFDSWRSIVEMIKAAQSAAYPHADDSFWERFVRSNARERPDGMVEFDYDPAVRTALLRPSPGPPPDMKLLFAALRPKPLLVLRGELSDIIGRPGVAVMREIKPDLEFAEIPGVGHAPTLDEPAAREALTGFLTRVP